MTVNTMRRFYPLLPAIILSAMPLYLALSISCRSVRVLEITHAETGDRVFRAPIATGNRFSLGYTHSVQLSRVEEEFEIDSRGGVALVSITFSDHGAGLPYDVHRGGVFFAQQDGKFKISDMCVSLPEIPLRVGIEYGNTFTFGSHHIDLSEMCGDALIIIRTR